MADRARNTRRRVKRSPRQTRGRQYSLPRVSTKQLAPGMRTVISEFESSSRNLGIVEHWNGKNTLEMDTASRDEVMHALKAHDRTKQALLRKLLRIQNGDEYVDVEQLKRFLRAMARTIHNMVMVAGGNATEIRAAVPSDLMKHVEDLIARRRTW